MKEEAAKTNTLVQKLQDIHTYEAMLATDSAFRNALLVVSVFINIAVLVTWMVASLS